METATNKGKLPPDAAGQKPTRQTVALTQLVTTAGTQVRSEISESVVAEYVEALGEGSRFPPIVVFRADGADVLADGFHRVRAYQKAGRDEIEADIYEGGPDEALWFALGANRAHGQRLNEGDKRRAIELAYKAWPDTSQRRIALHVGCVPTYVGQVRAQLSTTVQLPEKVVGRDGRRRPATRPAKPREPSKTEPAAPSPASAERPASAGDRSQPADAPAPAVATGPAAVATGPAAVATDPAVVATDPAAGRDPQQGGEQAPHEPQDVSAVSDPPQSGAEKSRGGVTARQSARDRSNRIVSVVADNAKNLMAQEDLIDVSALDRGQLAQWIEDLEEGRRLLTRFIRRLREGM